MNNDYLSKFYELGYTHDELEALLKKISDGELFTKEEHARLTLALNMLEGLTTFNGTYESLPDKPDIVDVVKQSGEFLSFTELNSKVRNLSIELENKLKQLVAELEKTKADIDHRHDDRYSLLNHDHDNRYATKNEIMNLVTKDYLDSVIAKLESNGGGGNGGSTTPTYKQPTLSVKSSSSYIAHKKESAVTITPTFTQNDAGPVKKVVIKKDDVVVHESVYIQSYEDSISLNHLETAVYSVTVEYEAGSIKAGSITKTLTIQGLANSYYGVIGNKQFNELDINSFTTITNATKEFTIVYNLDDQKSVYMYPKSFGDLSSIKDINNFDYINSYELFVIDFDEITYNVYVLAEATSMEVGFKQIFS